MTTLNLEYPDAIRARLRKKAKSAIAEQILAGTGTISRRIAQPPSRDMDLSAHIATIRDWLTAWKGEAERTPGMTLTTTRQSTRGVGFSLASGVTFDDLAAYASWLGSGREFSVAAIRIARLEELDKRLSA